jgi:thiosulfate sulfurtransferase
MQRISAAELEEWREAGRRFTLLDVRRAAVRVKDGAQLAGSHWRAPEGLFGWKDEIARDAPVVVYCAHGHEISVGVAATLDAMGLDARQLVDGFSGWRDSGRPVEPLPDAGGVK